MDDRLRLIGWILAGGGFGVALGGAFGAIAGYVGWRNGRAAGGVLGLTVARAYERAAGRELPPALTGAIVGAVDGLCFLGAIGCFVGAWAAHRQPDAEPPLWPFALGAVGLAAAACLFGLLAYASERAGLPIVAGFFLGGTPCALVGFILAGVAGLFAGMCLGALAGGLVVLFLLRRR